MDGILVIDKPAGITSHDVVAKVRRLLKTKRVGHTGTLDPFATGVMVILVGQATRLAQFLDKDEKEYEALVRFGQETDTGDRTGTAKTETSVDADEVREKLSDLDWDPVLSSFTGEIEQIPPMYSAKKVDGRKLYEHARRGETIERKPVVVNISEIEILEAGTDEIRIRVICSAGTYIRVLAEEIGRAVGIGGHLAELRRTSAGKFGIEQAVTLEQLAEFDDPRAILLPTRLAVSHLSKFVLADERIKKTLHGLSSRTAESDFINGEQVRMESVSGELIAVGIYDAGENSVRPKVVLV